MITLKRTTFIDLSFQTLVTELDQDLLNRYGPQQAQYDGLNQGLDEARVVIALMDGQPAGCGCFKSLRQTGTVEIKRMYVRPAFRGRGLAQQLLGELEGWAAELHYAKAVLQTADKQPEAVALYHKCGYRLITCYGAYQDDAASICMGKSISLIT